jgi:hypothetical protein
MQSLALEPRNPTLSARGFIQDGWLHGRMAVLRGVESGFSIARPALPQPMTVTAF